MTQEKTNSLIYKTKGETPDGEAVLITIRLNDECKNGHQDFSITGNVYNSKHFFTESNLISAGACHGYILAARPDLKLFVDLHMCDFAGVPIYGIENGYYFLRHGFNNSKPGDADFVQKFCSYYRLTEEQFFILNQSIGKIQYALNIQNLGILDQWKAEADKAIKQLEEWTGKTFVNDSVKSQFNFPTEEQIQEEKIKLESGYYSPAAQELRAKAKIQEVRHNLEKTRDKEIEKAKNDFDIKSQVLAIGGEKALKSCIIYDHSKTLAFNWLETNIIEPELIETIKEVIVLPEGYTIENKKK
jgi:hypothetical protein